MEGIMAPEVCNNAVVGGAQIPMLTLGIPGSAPAAVMLGALKLAVVIGQRGILRTEIAHLPIVAQEQAHGNFVHKLAFSAAGNACDREHKTTLELDQPVQILQSRQQSSAPLR